jgi:hypothetical protein
VRNEIHDFYLSPSTIGVGNRRGNQIGRKRNLYRILVGKAQGNRSFKTVRKWEINTEMDCK